MAVTADVLVVWLAAILMQTAAAWFSYRLYATNRLPQAWAFTAAFLIIIIRRIGVIFTEFGIAPEFTNVLSVLDKFILPFFNSFFLLYGTWYMMKAFENFDVVEKTTKEKIERMHRK